MPPKKNIKESTEQKEKNEMRELFLKTIIAILFLFAFIAFLIAINK